MKTITKYKTNDGREFDNEKDAKEHEQLFIYIQNIIHPLGEIPQGVKDENGWIQHSSINVLKVKTDLLNLAMKHGLFKGFPDIEKLIKENPDVIHPMSFVGRILSDSNSPIYIPWQRLACIDKNYREYQQPYFAINGPPAHQKCIVDRR